MQPAVEWQVAGACNYDCSYCIQSPRYRRGRPSLAALEAAIAAFAALDGVWEIKCSGGEAFAHPLFLDHAVPALMARTPHLISVLTNFSASDAELERFAALTAGRLAVVSASLHPEYVSASAFASKVAAFRDRVGPGVRVVVNEVLRPWALDEAAAHRAVVEAHGLRWYPQLYKEKGPDGRMRVADYPDEAALRALIGPAPGPREANVAPSYRGRACWSGSRYFTLDQEGRAWRCRGAKREGDPPLGRVDDGPVPLRPGPAPCPYALCTCSVPANRGMIAGIAGGVEEA